MKVNITVLPFQRIEL